MKTFRIQVKLRDVRLDADQNGAVQDALALITGRGAVVGTDSLIECEFEVETEYDMGLLVAELIQELDASMVAASFGRPREVS